MKAEEDPLFVTSRLELSYGDQITISLINRDSHEHRLPIGQMKSMVVGSDIAVLSMNSNRVFIWHTRDPNAQLEGPNTALQHIIYLILTMMCVNRDRFGEKGR